MLEKGKLKKNIYILLFIIVLIILGILTSNYPYNSFRIPIQFIFLLVAIGLVSFSIKRDNLKNLPINAFWIIMIFGTLISLIKPVQFGLDEESHLKATLSLSDSPVFLYQNEEQNDYENVAVHDMLRAGDKYKDDQYWYSLEHESSRISGGRLSFDNPSYIPGMIGWNLGKMISDKVFVSYYLGRISFVITYALLVFYALKLTLSYQKMLFVMATLPSAINVIAGYSYDYLYYGCSLIIVAILTNIFTEKSKLTLKNLIIFELAVFGIAMAKLPIALLGFLPLLIPRKYVAEKKLYWATFCLTTIAILLGLLRTVNFVSGGSVASSSGVSLGYVLQHPLPFLRTMAEAPAATIFNFINMPLRYPFLSRHTDSGNLASTIVFFLLIGLLSFYYKIKFSKKFTIGLSFILVVITFAVVYAISGDARVYTLGDSFINGVQGRYYFIYLCFLPILLSNIKQKILPNKYLTESDFNINLFIVHSMVYLNIFIATIDLFIHL